MKQPSQQQTGGKAIKLTWEKDVEDLIRKKVKERQSAATSVESVDGPSTKSSPLMVAIVGIPGSGKSTSAAALQESLCRGNGERGAGIGCMLMPFDGYHYPMMSLKSFPDPDDAIYRRGAPDTFDAAKLISDLSRIRHGADRADKNDEVVELPGFDHARGDPEEGAHAFRRSVHSVVICEGLYLLHDEDGWEKVKDYFDLSVFVEANIDVCMERVKVRNKVIPGYAPEEIDIRVDAVDRVNAITVERSKSRADIVVKSAATE